MLESMLTEAEFSESDFGIPGGQPLTRHDLPMPSSAEVF